MSPGLVGGHCISVDPYYLIQKAQVYGVLPRIMTSARRLNDGMGAYVAEQTIKCMNKKGVLVKNSRILILGITFKENCPDTRNTKVIDIYRELQEYGITPVVSDPAADADEAERLYGIRFADLAEVKDMDAVILAVSHEQFKALTLADFDRFYRGAHQQILIDVKAMLDKEEFIQAGYLYWRL